VGRQLTIYFVHTRSHPWGPCNAHPQPGTALLSGLPVPGLSNTRCEIRMLELWGSRCITPVWSWLFIKQEKETFWMNVSETEELKHWLLLTYQTENTRCLSLKPSKIPGLSRWLITPFVWGHSLCPMLTSRMTSDAKCLHHFLKEFWGTFENVKLDNSCRAKFKAP